MAQLLQPLSIFDFTPPASPTKFPNTMKWLTRTPSSVPLPPSPTKSTEGSDDDNKSIMSSETSISIQSNFSMAMRSLKKTSSAFSLRPKPSPLSLAATPLGSSPLVTSPLGTSQREYTPWFSRPSLARATSSVPPTADLGDHFARSLPNHEEKQEQLHRRKEAAQKRLQGMRTALGIKVKEGSPNAQHPPARSHQRYDSGCHENADDSALQERKECVDTNTSDTAPEPQNPDPRPIDQDILSSAVFRLRRTPAQLPCIGCQQTHRSSLTDGDAVVWLLQKCRHYVHAQCFDKLQDLADPDPTECLHCERFKLMLERLGEDETRRRHRRLLEETDGNRYTTLCA